MYLTKGAIYYSPSCCLSLIALRFASFQPAVLQRCYVAVTGTSKTRAVLQYTNCKYLLTLFQNIVISSTRTPILRILFCFAEILQHHVAY